MELEPDLRLAKEKLETSIIRYRNVAIVLAIMAFIPFFVAGYYNFTNPKYLFIEETGSYIGGFSAPFASLAGIFFVYVAFLGQRLQIIYQQQELRTSQKELQETRQELKGQKEQLELQNKQFERQTFENTFFKLVDHHQTRQEFFLTQAGRFSQQRKVVIDQTKKYSAGKMIEYIGEKLEHPIALEEINLEVIRKIYRKNVILNGALYLVKAIVLALTHVHDAHPGIDQKKYLDMLYNLTATSEKTLLVSFVLFDRRDVDDLEFDLLVQFTKRIERKYYIFGHLYETVQDIPTLS